MKKTAQKITLKQVAEKAGVSLSTASLVANGNESISRLVREKVLAAIKTLGYQKIISASVSQKLFGAAVLMPITEQNAHSWNIYTRIIQSFERELAHSEYYPVLIPINDALDTNRVFRMIADLRVKGVLSIHHISAEFTEYLRMRKIPLVVVNNSAFAYSGVFVDDFRGAHTACVKALAAGHKNIAYFDYPRSDLPNVAYDRYLGYSRAMMEAGLEKRMRQYTIALSDERGMEQQLRSCLKGAHAATAVMAHDDYMAMHLYVLLEKLGFAIPRDVSLLATGGGVLDYSLSYVPQITCTELDTEKLGMMAGRLLTAYMNGEEIAAHRLIIEQVYRERKTLGSPRSS